MLITIKPKQVIFVAILIYVGLHMSTALADDPKIIHVAGKAELLEAKAETPTQANVGAQLKPGSTIVVVGKGTVEIKIGTESINATAGEDTQLEYKGRSLFKGVERFTLHKGRALFKIKKGDKLDVKTPHVVASVRGTEFLANADENKSSISVISGSVHTRDQRGNNLDLNSDSYAVIDEQGIVEVGKGRYGRGITGKVRTEKRSKVKTDKRSHANPRTGAFKSKPAKGRAGKIGSKKDRTGKSGTSLGGIGKGKAEKGDSGKGNAGGKSSGGGNSGKGNAGGEGNSGGGKGGGGNAGDGKSGGGNAGDGKSDKGAADNGKSGKGKSGKGNSGKEKSSK